MADQEKIIRFMNVRHLAGVVSLVFILASLVSLATQGLNLGLDFTGGTLIEVEFDEAVPLPALREKLDAEGYKNAVVVNFGSERDVLIRLATGYSDQVGEQVLEALRSEGRGVELRRVEFVGPQVGGELRDQGGLDLSGGVHFSMAASVSTSIKKWTPPLRSSPNFIGLAPTELSHSGVVAARFSATTNSSPSVLLMMDLAFSC